MTASHDRYGNPLADRYASERMASLFSARTRIRIWRELWIALAEAERALGLPISARQIADLRAHANTINFDVARAIEREVRHDVMAHVLAYGRQAPSAAGIIHLGATSCYVTDNADLLIYRDALRLISDRVTDVIRSLAAFARREKNRPTLGYTHLQPAQLTTVGKRASLWLQDFHQDAGQIAFTLSTLRFLGVKGATGTQASFLDLFKGNARKATELDRLITRRFGFAAAYPVCGQTYPRKVDAALLSCLTGIALSVSKMTNDIRYLQSVGELEEPFGRKQIGSSAMAYKRNPMRSERADSLARLVISLATSPQMTAATQFLERTLDDSANRRIVLPEAFLAAEAALIIVRDIASGLVVYPAMIARRIEKELPFLATETIMMMAVEAGKSRQEVHERIRVHAMAATTAVRSGGTNDLLERIAADPAIGLDLRLLRQAMRPARFIGRAPAQVADYLARDIGPFLRRSRRYFPADDAGVHV